MPAALALMPASIWACLVTPLPHALQNLVVARLQADVEAVELQLGIALQPLGLQAVDGVRPGIGGDALDLGESGVEVLQHVGELVRGMSRLLPS